MDNKSVWDFINIKNGIGTVCYEINLQIVKDLLRGNSSNKWDADTKDAYQNLLHFM